MSKFTLPSKISTPIHPVVQGSVLSQLLESTNAASLRRPKLMNGTQNDSSSSPASIIRPRSKIPKRQETPQNTAFERSLRQYKVKAGSNSSPGTPRAGSRATSPNKGPRSNSAVVESKIPCPSYREIHEKRHPKSKSFASKPPNLPMTKNRNKPEALDDSPAKLFNQYEPRPVKLGYGINQKTPTTDVYGWPISKFHPDEERKARKLVSEERCSRALHTQVVQKLEHGQLSCADVCEHEEIACQTISSELLLITEKRKTSQDANTSTGAGELCNLLNNNVEGVTELNTHCAFLKETIENLKGTVDDLTSRNEALELQYFEIKEKCVELESSKCEENKTYTNFGVNTEESLRGKMKFPLDDFILSHCNESHEGDTDDNTVEFEKRLKMMKIALAARDGLLNELKVKFKKACKIFQTLCDALRTSLDDFSSPFVEISPPKANHCFHSYRKFVRFINTYLEGSLQDIHELDRTTAGIESKNVCCDKEIGVEKVFDGVIPTELANPEEEAQNDLKDIQHVDENEAFTLSPNAPEVDLQGKSFENEEKLGNTKEIENIGEMKTCEMGEKLQAAAEDDAETDANTIEVEEQYTEEYLEKADVEPAEKPLEKTQELKNGGESKKSSEEILLPRLSASVADMTYYESIADSLPRPLRPIPAAKLWLDRTSSSSMTNFILKPISFTKIFDPLQDPVYSFSSDMKFNAADALNPDNFSNPILEAKSDLLQFNE